MTPFFEKRNEVLVSEEISSHYHLYRVFKFDESPQLFVLLGSSRDQWELDATHYRVSLPRHSSD